MVKFIIGNDSLCNLTKKGVLKRNYSRVIPILCIIKIQYFRTMVLSFDKGQ